jgi:hypothetical protein
MVINFRTREKKNQEKDQIDSHGEEKLVLQDKSVVILSFLSRRFCNITC